MMKVKLISSDDHSLFEKWVNDFIRDKEVYSIEYQCFWFPTAMTGPSITDMKIVDRALIRYKEVSGK